MLDPRGPRFVASVTTVVLVVILATGSGRVALAQAGVFALGSLDPRWNPYALVFRYLVRPRLGPPSELEDVAPVRFAQWVGLTFILAAAIAYLAGGWVVGTVLAAFALGAAFLNAAFGLCLGCELFVLLGRLRTRA
jgi:hypothetical protein